MTAAQATLRRRFQLGSIGILGAGLALLILTIMRWSEGVMGYSLDDPYIHLSLAENLLRGHYGINPGENASPSSSIIYPFIMAAGLATGLGDLTPLFVNIIGIALCVWTLAGMLWDALPEKGAARVPLSLVALVTMMLAINAFALPITGMEHTLHAMASVLVITGLAAMIRDDRGPSAVLLFAIVLCPLLRFEGLALAGMALLVILVRGYWRASILTGLLIVALLAAYVITMRNLGLPPLPSSVMVKSGVSAAAGAGKIGSTLRGLYYTFIGAFETREALVVLALAAALAIGAVVPATSKFRAVAIAASAAAIAHVFAGAWGWFGRYEIYVIAMEIAAILVVYRPVTRTVALAPVILAIAFALIAKPYLQITKETPAAARWIHGEQFQMHRFVTEFFPEVVAVNDLGWVSYRNDNYILDLWGLGSEEVRKLVAQQDHQPEWIAELATRKQAVYAMIFDAWFGDAIPPDWCRVAQMSSNSVFGSRSTVAFYLIDRSREADMRTALDKFAATLPATTVVTQEPCAQ